MHPKTIGLVAHPGKPGVGELINSLAAEFSRRSMSILLEKETAAVAGKKSDLAVAQIATGDPLWFGPCVLGTDARRLLREVRRSHFQIEHSHAELRRSSKRARVLRILWSAANV